MKIEEGDHEPRKGGGIEKVEKAKKRFSPQPPEGTQPYDTFI